MFNYIFWLLLLAGNFYVITFIIRDLNSDTEKLYDSLNTSFDQINSLSIKVEELILDNRILEIKNINLYERIDALQIENDKLKKQSY